MIPEQHRCIYQTPSGRRCRSNAVTGWRFCPLHGDRTPGFPVAVPLVCDGDRLDTAEGIHIVMARVLRGQAAGKIRAREATAMMYSCQTMLYALPRVAEERKQGGVEEEEEAWRQQQLADSLNDELETVNDGPAGER